MYFYVYTVLARPTHNLCGFPSNHRAPTWGLFTPSCIKTKPTHNLCGCPSNHRAPTWLPLTPSCSRTKPSWIGQRVQAAALLWQGSCARLKHVQQQLRCLRCVCLCVCASGVCVCVSQVCVFVCMSQVYVCVCVSGVCVCLCVCLRFMWGGNAEERSYSLTTRMVAKVLVHTALQPGWQIRSSFIQPHNQDGSCRLEAW